MKSNPCYNEGQGCAERHVGCHIECSKYKAWREELDAMTAELKRRAQEQRDLIEQYNTYGKRRRKYQR